MKKITSEKFMRFYVVASFVMIVFLSVAVVTLVSGQNEIKREMAKSYGTESVLDELDSIRLQLNGIGRATSELRSSTDSLSDSVDNLDSAN